jgi:hypothetical protein
VSDRKTLLPELLPEPWPGSGAGPRDRVAARARVMLDRLAGLKTAAGAALLAAHCGYGVVDPLPPPPAECSAIGDPFSRLYVTGGPVPADGGEIAAFDLASSTSYGYAIAAVRVTAGGTLISVADEHVQDGTNLGARFAINVMPDGSGQSILFEVDLQCGGAATTKHYRATLDGIRYDVVSLD